MRTTTGTPPEPHALPAETFGLVRAAVRSLLSNCPAYSQLPPEDRRALAESMVRVSNTAAVLIREEMDTGREAQRIQPPRNKTPSADTPPASRSNDANSGHWKTMSPPARAGPPAPLARAQAAGDKFSGVAADRVAGTTRNILNAVSFPRFVTELITGVFRAIVDSSQEQMRAYVELLRNVAATTEGFADTTMSNYRARQWLADQFPGSLQVEQDEDAEVEPGQAPESLLRLRPGATMPSEQALRAALGIPPDQSVPTGDPERALVPFAKLAIARQRQQMLATLVMLGMQRIVIESGRINASMRFHIDTRSAAQADEGSRFALDNEIKASGSFGAGPWGASASVRNNIAYVSTQKTQTTEEMNTDLDLNSSVELYFKSDYLPLDRLAGAGQQDRIRANTLNPDSEAKIAADARSARMKAATESDTARRTALDKGVTPGAPAAPSRDGDPGTQGAADKARKEAGNRGRSDAGRQPGPSTGGSPASRSPGAPAPNASGRPGAGGTDSSGRNTNAPESGGSGSGANQHSSSPNTQTR